MSGIRKSDDVKLQRTGSVTLRIELFKQFNVLRNGKLVTIRNERRQKLLALLALNGGRTLQRAEIADRLYKEGAGATAPRDLLKVDFNRLLLDLGAECAPFFVVTRHTLCLREAAEVDVVHFDQAISVGSKNRDKARLEEAVAFYRGPLLEKWPDDWVQEERGQREEAYLGARVMLAALADEEGDHALAADHLRPAFAVDPLRTDVVYRLMKALAAAGDPRQALQVFRRHQLLCRQEANVAPARKLVALERQIREDAQQQTALRSSRSRLEEIGFVPQPATALIGRKEEVDQIRARFRLERLVVLWGPGGIGKTRLAIHVAHEEKPHYLEGAWFVDLQEVRNPDLITQRVAEVFKVKEEPGWPLRETLKAFLREQHLLLILDNCEHLSDSVAELAQELLLECSKLRILVTTRCSLGVPDEISYPVIPLSLSEAVCLFEARAAAAKPAFALTEENASTVVQICRDLEGIPIALELAAALIQYKSVEQIAAGLVHRYRLLKRSRRGALARHSSLQASMDLSYYLLSEKARILLHRVSVFAGGWSLEAAQAVGAGEGITADQVDDLLAELVAHSLVQADTLGRADQVDDLPRELVAHLFVQADTLGRAARYRMLETIRKYAEEKLIDPAEQAAVHKRHFVWYHALAASMTSEHEARREQIDLLELEHDNLHAALARARGLDMVEAALRLADLMGRFWEIRGYWAEGYQCLVRLLDLPEAKSATAARADALARAGVLAVCQADYQSAHSLFQESIAIYRRLADKRSTATSLHWLGGVYEHMGQYDLARAQWDECLALWRELGERLMVAATLLPLASLPSVMDASEFEEAHTFLQEALDIGREFGAEPIIIGALGGLALLGYRGGEIEEPDRLRHELFRRIGEAVEEELANSLWLGGRHGIASLFLLKSHLYRAVGNWELARSRIQNSLILLQQFRVTGLTANCLHHLGEIATILKQHQRGARLLAAARALRDALGITPSPTDRVTHDRRMAEARAALGDETLAAVRAEGEAMTVDQAVAYALQEEGNGSEAETG